MRVHMKKKCKLEKRHLSHFPDSEKRRRQLWGHLKELDYFVGQNRRQSVFNRWFLMLPQLAERDLPLPAGCPKHDVLHLFTGAFKLSPWFWNHNLTWLIPTTLWVTSWVALHGLPHKWHYLCFSQTSAFAYTPTQASRSFYCQTCGPGNTESFPSVSGRDATTCPPRWASFSAFYSLSTLFFSQVNHPSTLSLEHPTGRTDWLSIHCF